jgi:hypothetical protein
MGKKIRKKHFLQFGQSTPSDIMVINSRSDKGGLRICSCVHGKSILTCLQITQQPGGCRKHNFWTTRFKSIKNYIFGILTLRAIDLFMYGSNRGGGGGGI